MSVSDLKLVLSAVFIVLGAIVFYVSSLVSGHNIYKDLSFNLAMMVTTIIGFIIFIFSPICFVILFPYLFQVSGTTPIYEMSSKNFDKYDMLSSHFIGYDEIMKVNTIHSLILKEMLGAYILMAIGIGLLFGCLSAIQARPAILRWIRKITGLKYPIYGYGETWDHLLMRVKSHGRILLKVDQIKVEGQLVVYSVKKEPKQIILQNYRTSSNGEYSTKQNPGQLLITEFNNIKEIEVPCNSFNRHKDLIPHTTQSFYITLAAFGLVLISTSLILTANFLQKFFPTLSCTYNFASCMFLILSLVFTFISSLVYKKDFKTILTAVALYPFTLLMVLLEVDFIIIAQIIFRFKFLPTLLKTVFIAGHISLTAISAYVMVEYYNLKYKLKEITSLISKHQLKDILEEMYANIDLNNEESKIWIHKILHHDVETVENLVEEVIKKVENFGKIDTDTVNGMFKGLGNFISNYTLLGFFKGFLLDDERSVVVLVHTHVAHEEGWEQSKQCEIGGCP